jgi:Mn2+/Fe2+ NRAMP family transporter
MTAPHSTVTAPAGRRRWTAKVLAVLAILGPGLIAANAGNDAGGILTYASAGAQFGYRTLFLMVLVTVALVVVQEMCSRLGVYTGEGLGGLIREQFSPRSTFAAMTLLLVANAGLTVSEFAGVGAAMEIFGGSRFISVPIAAVFVWALTVLAPTARRAAVYGADTGLVTYPMPLLGHPSGHEVLTNLVSPHFPASHAFLVLAVASSAPPSPLHAVRCLGCDKHITPANYRSSASTV